LAIKKSQKMKNNYLLLAVLLTTLFSYAQTPCSGGTAAGFDCNGMTLQSHLTIAQMGGQGYGGGDPAEAQDSWGWTDSMTGKEYALVAMNDKTSFVDISDPNNPVYLGKLDSHTGTSWWRDVKVFNNYAYIVSDNNGSHGVQIFDLTKLRTADGTPVVNFSRDGLYSGISNAHNLIIDEDNGFAYILGSNRNGGGPRVLDLSNPTNLTVAGNISAYGYCHDAQVVTYNGPDTEHVGKQIMIGSFSDSDFVRVLDVTNKSNVTQIGNIDYNDKYYTHQGWFTEDQRFFIVGDELDETNGPGFNTRTLVFDMQDLDNPVLHYTHYGATPAIDHNGYVKGNRFYLANYRAGMRVFKFEDLYDPAITVNQMQEVEFFDTHPGSNSAAYHGAWNVYPFFESGNIIISDLDQGLFVVKDPNYDTTPPVVVCQPFTAVLNKATGTVTIDALDVDGGSTDNIGIIKRTLTGQTTFTCADLGLIFNVELTVEDDYGLSTSCSTTVTVAGETTVYQGGGSWSNGLPDIGSNAKISTQDYDTAVAGNGSFSACTCEIDANRTLTVGADTYIELENDIVVDGTLVVKHTGNVVQRMEDAQVIKGLSAVINVELATPVLQTRDFMVMGSPMTADTRGGVFTNAFLVLDHHPLDFIPYAGVPQGATNFSDDNGNFWTSYTGTINPAEGYIVRPQSGYSDPANVSYDMTYFEGTLNSGPISRPAIFNGATPNPDGTPIIFSNPYASAISATDFISHNALVNEVYFWEHLTPPSVVVPGEGLRFDMDDVSIFNGSMGIPASNDDPITPVTTPNGIISTGQGFAIKSFGTGNVEFTNAMRLTSGNTTLRTQESNLWSENSLVLNVTASTYQRRSNTGIAFNPLGTDGLDTTLDTRRLGTIVSLYSQFETGEEELGIQTLGDLTNGTKVLLGFQSQIAAEDDYTISLITINGDEISEATIYLFDSDTGITTNLKENDYIFRSGKIKQDRRFTVLFEIAEDTFGVENLDSQNIIIYPNPTTDILNILSAQQPIKQIEIYDMRGRLIQQNIDEDITTTSVDISRFETGIYFVKVFLESGSITKKFIKE
jgi:choice-of-anchor B domain-containing protein